MRRGAHAACLRVSPPPERQPPQWRLRVCHANAGCVLEVTARTSYHGLAPKERGLPLAMCPPIVRRPITTSAARRALGKLACFATSRETATVVALACVPRECRLRVRAHSSHLAPRSCAERERPSAGDMPSHSTWADRNQRGTARMRQARVFRHLPRDSHRSGTCVCATRMPATRWRSQFARRITVLCRKRDSSRRCGVLLKYVGRSQPARHGAHAASLRVSPPPERQPP